MSLIRENFANFSYETSRLRKFSPFLQLELEPNQSWKRTKVRKFALFLIFPRLRESKGKNEGLQVTLAVARSWSYEISIFNS